MDLNLGSEPITRWERSFSHDPDTVIAMASEYIDAYQDSGIALCLKHFPGHGAIPVDTHCASASVNGDMTTASQERRVFFELHRQYPQVFIMVAHLIDPTLDPQLPGTLSKAWRMKLHQDFSSEARFISDDLSMGALHNIGTREEILTMALTGPMDYVIFSQHSTLESRPCFDTNKILKIIDNINL